MKPRSFACKSLGRTSLLATLVFTGIAAQSASAGNVTLIGSDGNSATNTSLINDVQLKWNPAGAPVAGNDYFTAAFTIRSPNNSNSYTFAGDSLTIDGGSPRGQFLFKNTGTTGIITVNNLILNGGIINFANSNSDNNVATLAGAISVNGDSYMGALGGNNWVETLNVTAAISGSAGLTIAGSVPNNGTDTGVVRFSAANTYSGTVTVASPNGGTVASATSRLLQLNHLNALQSATLNLTSVANGVSFTSAANTGAFNVGGLSGSSNQKLIDTVLNPITLNVGANDANTSYTGILSGPGALIKSGAGTLTFSTIHTYSGNTTVSAGTLSISSPYIVDSSNLTIASGAFLNLTYGGTDVVGGLTIAGDPKGEGIYGALGSAAPVANQTDRITGSGLIQVIYPTPQSISLIASDPAGASSFTTELNWSNGIAPTVLNNYLTGAFDLRTSTSAATYTFAGASLSVDAGGRFIGKGAGGTTTQTVTVNNLILNGGILLQAQSSSDTAVLDLLGSINVTAPSAICAYGSPNNNSASFETVNIQSTISGSEALTIAGVPTNSDWTGVVKLNAANPYSGNITVAQPRAIASATNRLLQLNNLDAIANATLTLATTTANGVSFAAAVNTGDFKIGALAGTANQSLTDTAGGNVTLNVGGNGSSTNYSGSLTGDGSLIKSGAGTQTLSGANFYTGATSVNQGTLVFSGSNQQVGSVTVADGAGIGFKAGNDVDIVAATTDLTLGTSGPTNLKFDFNGFNSAATFLFTGAFAANGPVNVTAANGNYLTTGIYNLVIYSSFSGTSPSGVIPVGTRGSGTLLNDTGNGLLNLDVTNDMPKWTGLDSGGIWKVGSTGGPGQNWKLVSANTPTDYIETDTVLFDDSAAGTKIVDVSTANVTPTGVTFDTSTSYTLGGAFGIAGTTPLLKSGSGSLIIKNTNTYTGATTINEGTLQLGDGVTDGSIAASSNIVNDGSLVFNRVGNFINGGKISGFGSLVKSGPGSQTLAAANNYSGTTLVSGGTLANGINLALPATTDLTVSGGTYNLAGFDQTLSSLSDGGSGAGTVTNSGALKTLTVNTGTDSTFSGEISGTLNLYHGGFGKLTLPDSNSYTGTTRLLNGTVAVGNDGALGTGQIDFAGGAIESSNGSARTFTNPINFSTNMTFSGTGNLTFTKTPPANGTDKTLTVTNPQTEFQGVLGGPSGRTKEGSGLLIFSGLNNYTGATTVNAGTLRITNPVLNDAAALVIAGSAVLDLPYAGTDQVGALTIAGDVKADGVYGAIGSAAPVPNQTAAITGSGLIRVGPPPAGFAGFMDSFPGLTPAQKLPGADPDFDGISNLVEYALAGLDPTMSNASPGTLAGGVLTFNKRALAVSNNDVTYNIEASTTLGAAPSPWTILAKPPVMEDSISISYTLPPGQPKQFNRLRVSQN